MGNRLTVFAGTGDLVPHAVEAAQKAGYKVQVLALTPRPDLSGIKVVKADLANPLGIIWSLKVFRTSHVVLAGGITLSDGQREGLAKFANSNSERPATSGGGSLGDAALTGLAAVLKKMAGAELVGVHEIAPDLLAQEGVIVGSPLPGEHAESAGFALAMAREIGRLDIGQAVVVAGHHVISAEDIGGTDGLLARVGDYHARGVAGDGAAPLILAKAAGVSVIAVEAGKSIIIEREKVLDLARRENITIVGLTIDG